MKKRIDDPYLIYKVLKANGIKVKEKSQIPALRTDIVPVHQQPLQKLDLIREVEIEKLILSQKQLRGLRSASRGVRTLRAFEQRRIKVKK